VPREPQEIAVRLEEAEVEKATDGLGVPPLVLRSGPDPGSQSQPEQEAFLRRPDPDGLGAPACAALNRLNYQQLSYTDLNILDKQMALAHI
jgi:hypothetical protein